MWFNKNSTITDRFLLVFFILLSLYACNNRKGKDEETSSKTKILFQGVWLDDDNEMPVFWVKGDTIYHADNQNTPVAFDITNDTLFMFGNETSRYLIDKHSEHLFWFHSLAGDIIKLHKSEVAEDTLAFSKQSVQIIPTYAERVQKDSVVLFGGKRYRAYVYINPSKTKVINTSYSEDGISVDNVYYDNVMHICVYEGKKSLYASDITKQTFSGMIPDEFLRKAVLSEMSFTGVSHSGFHYVATICTPENALCYMVELIVRFDGKPAINILE